MLVWLRGSDTRAPLFLDVRSSKAFITFTVALAVFTDNFAYGIVVPVFPFALTSRAGIDPGHVQTQLSVFLAVYGATLLVCAPFFGWIADHTKSRQVPFLAGLLLLAGSTVMLCVGDSIALFAVGRALQGASAAVVWVVGLTLLVDTFGTDGVGTAMGYVGLSMSMAFILASLLGGIVFAKSGYYSVYAMAFGLVVLDTILRLAMIERRVAKKWLPSTDLPPAGQKVVSSGTAIEVHEVKKDIAHQEASRHMSDASEKTLNNHEHDLRPLPDDAKEISEEDSTLSLGKRIGGRLPPVIFLFGSRRILAALFACTMQSVLLTSFDATLPLHVRNTFGWDSTGAGLIFLPLVLAIFISPMVGALSDKYGPRWLATAGFVMSCPFLILLRLVDHNSIRQKVLLSALLVLIGIGLTLASTPVMAEISYAIEAKSRRRPVGFFGKNGAYAQAYGLYIMAWAAGATIGPLLAGLVMQASGWATATLILGCLSISAALPTAIWTGGSIFKKRRSR